MCSDINKWKGMKFDIVVGNPPYGVAQKGSSPTLHLKIMKNSLSFCTDKLTFIMPSKPITVQLKGEWYDMFVNAVCYAVEVVSKKTFPTTDMDNTTIYYCNRKEKKENYCKKFDVDKRLYDMFVDTGHRLFVGRMNVVEHIDIYGAINDSSSEKIKKKVICKLNDGKYYMNVSNIGNTPGKGCLKWVSEKLKDVDILSKKCEIDYLNGHKVRLNIIECPNKDYGINLKNLMVNGLVLRYSLWLLQFDRAIYQAQFKYVPDIDYTYIHNDEELLTACGFTSDEIEKVMDYLRHFDFSKNRNDVVREYTGNI